MNFCGEIDFRPSTPNFKVWFPLIQVTLSTAWYKFWIENCGALGSGPMLTPPNSIKCEVGKGIQSGQEGKGRDGEIETGAIVACPDFVGYCWVKTYGIRSVKPSGTE